MPWALFAIEWMKLVYIMYHGGSMNKNRIYINDEWGFTEEFSEELLSKDYKDENLTQVRIPHTVKETPLHYFDEHEYQMISGYRRVLSAPRSWKGKTVLLTFDGIAHAADVYVNGELVGSHYSGYTAFTIDITKNIKVGGKNIIVVKCDSNETLNVPPFGFVIDYMTYGGIYRDVYIDVKEESYIKDVFITTKLAERYIENGVRKCKASQTDSLITIQNAKCGMTIRQSLSIKGSDDSKQILLEKMDIDDVEKHTDMFSALSGDIELWDVEHPALYEMKTELLSPEDDVLDTCITTFGFRRMLFKVSGFFLNGRRVKIRGLNRHQSYPYVGYAMPESQQRRDAYILKNELGLNAVRTSHYPQSQYFLDECDRLGLMVFTEFPGWQHIGDDEWKEQALVNEREMIEQYRNHPSIMLWGVRINESVDDDDFYSRTNALAHSLDPSRQTGGVRCYKKGSFLEDVYTYNDFSHDGKHKGCDKKVDVTTDVNRPYLISEYNGHMYPTKAFDWEEHRMEHMKRHATVIDEVMKQEDIAGSFGWCMFDYNTHKDFGSGDRICYHGVMDMFRNPKLAAYVYASQQEKTPVLEISSSMDIGEHPGCNRGDVYILTNADSVKMYKNDRLIKEYLPENSPFKYLKHGPMMIDDYIGDAIREGEPDMSDRQIEDLKLLLNEVAKVGLYGMSKIMLARAGYVSMRYQMSMTDAVAMYNKYIGDWGGESTTYRFEAIKDGEIVKTVIATPMVSHSLKVDVDHTDLKEDHSYDVASVRILDVDNNGNVLHFSNDPICLSVEGPIEIIGPSVVTFNGGMGGTYIKTTGETGEAKLIIEAPGIDKKEISFSISK